MGKGQNGGKLAKMVEKWTKWPKDGKKIAKMANVANKWPK